MTKADSLSFSDKIKITYQLQKTQTTRPGQTKQHQWHNNKSKLNNMRSDNTKPHKRQQLHHIIVSFLRSPTQVNSDTRCIGWECFLWNLTTFNSGTIWFGRVSLSRNPTTFNSNTRRYGRVMFFPNCSNLWENRYIRREICPQTPANFSNDTRWFPNIFLKEGNVKTSTSAITLMKYEIFSNFRLSSFLSWYW